MRLSYSYFFNLISDTLSSICIFHFFTFFTTFIPQIAHLHACLPHHNW
jgi:hypothetical protein